MEHPLTDAQAAAEARRLIEDAYRPAHQMPTSYRDDSPLPAYGTTPPVPQPGRPPMSQRATDISTVMLAAGAASVPIGGSAALVLWALGHVDPVIVGIVCGAPVALLGALSRVVKRVREATPPANHHHYNGPVIQDHRSYTSQTRGVIAHTRNQLHR